MSKKHSTTFKTTIDLEELKKQKTWLLNHDNSIEAKGLIHLLDAMQDNMVDNEGVSENDVFVLTEEKTSSQIAKERIDNVWNHIKFGCLKEFIGDVSFPSKFLIQFGGLTFPLPIFINQYGKTALLIANVNQRENFIMRKDETDIQFAERLMEGIAYAYSAYKAGKSKKMSLSAEYDKAMEDKVFYLNGNGHCPH